MVNWHFRDYWYTHFWYMFLNWQNQLIICMDYGDIITAKLDMYVKSEQYVNKTQWYKDVKFVSKVKGKMMKSHFKNTFQSNIRHKKKIELNIWFYHRTSIGFRGLHSATTFLVLHVFGWRLKFDIWNLKVSLCICQIYHLYICNIITNFLSNEAHRVAV